MSAPRWDRERILEMAGAFRPACVLGAAAELNLFTALGDQAATAEELARQLSVDLRGLRMLLDATTALGLLEKRGDAYSVPAQLQPLLAEGPDSVLPMVWHSMSILRGWTQVARVVQSGQLPPRQASIRGADADRAAFVAAMHTVSGPIADPLVAKLGPPRFTHLLDVGGASGTWTLAFLRAIPGAKATIFDLPDAIQQAQARIQSGPFAARIQLVPGDFYRDELPAGADYAWVSAIIHQHSQQSSRELFAKIFRALQPGGQIGVRDIVMAPDRTRPLMGALFAINMLVNTETGGTYTFGEIAEDLGAAGFVDPRLSVPADDMTAVVEARKP
jgi:SAM-dependent methyltransferase